MKLLDLFCGGGGAGEGYARAGFDVTGVDIDPQPNYPYEFLQADALAVLRGETSLDPGSFDVIHASPPCQSYSPHVSSSSSKWVPTAGKDEPALIAPVRDLLWVVGKPYVIENVYGARGELAWPILLCGTMFGLPIPRHRVFEIAPHRVVPPPHGDCRGVAKAYAAERGWEYRDMSVTGKGRHAGTADRWAEIMDIRHPMRQHDFSEAIPPAYTEYIGASLVSALEQTT